MTIYWERCMVCGRYIITRECTLHSDIAVCIYCCTSCVERSRCPRVVWDIVVEKPKLSEKKLKLEDKKEIMAKLFSKLEAKSGV